MKHFHIRLGQTSFEARPGESLVDASQRSAVAIPFSCCAGVCHTCLLKCVQGQVPAAASKGLPTALAARGYLLACQCHPTQDMVLALPDPADRHIDCMLHEVQRAGPFIHLRFEAAHALACRPGEAVQIAMAPRFDAVGELTWLDEANFLAEVLLPCDAGSDRDACRWLLDAAFGQSFTVRGPLPRADAQSCDELRAPATDPGLWTELGEGVTVRAVLEDFYRQVYADGRLAPFFDGITIERSIEKQYSFLKQLMTGQRVYFGDRPRNAHHWMVITEELFDHRQALMHATLARHGLVPAQIARWTRLEAHWRRDIVKARAWPRRMHGVELPLEGYAREVLSEATVCDHCAAPVAAGTEVSYHLRLGRISCPQCTGEAAVAVE